MIDCMIVGFNAVVPDEYVSLLRLGGRQSVGYRDANLTFVEHGKHVHTSMQLVDNHCGLRTEDQARLSNADFLWPAITTIGTYLHRNGHTFDYIRLFQEDKEKLRQALLRGEIRLVAITTTVYVSPQPILEIIQFVRSVSATTPIVVGGPAVAGWPKLNDVNAMQQLMAELDADYFVFSSEGEATLGNLITALKKLPAELAFGAPNPVRLESLATIHNLAYKSGSGYTVNAMQAEDNVLESNMTMYDLFSRDHFGEFVTLRTAKSCPFACSFCGFPERAGAYRYLSVDDVRRELQAIAALGNVTTITFIDDTFNVPKARFKEILRMMIEEKFGFHWNSYLRSDHVDDEALQLMAESGCEGVFLGAESGSVRILEAMNKRSRPHHYKKVIERCRELGITTYASLIVGFPGETAESVQETIDFIESARPDFFRAQPWFADPLTPVFRMGAQFGLEGEAFDWRHASMCSDEAIAHVERMFLTIQGSTWLPQNDFELWSVFYLQRKGISVERIKQMLMHFNGAIRKKLLFNDRTELTAAEFSAMCAGFADPQNAAAPMYLPTQLAQAMAYWMRDMGRVPARSGLAKLAPASAAAPVTQLAVMPLPQASAGMLAPAASALWRILADETGLTRAVVPVLDLQHEEPVIQVALLEQSNAADADSACAVINQVATAPGQPHLGAALLYLLNNPALCDSLDVQIPGITFACAGTVANGGVLQDLRSRYPHDFQGLDLLLAEVGSGDERVLMLEYVAGVYAAEDMQDLAGMLQQRLQAMDQAGNVAAENTPAEEMSFEF